MKIGPATPEDTGESPPRPEDLSGRTIFGVAIDRPRELTSLMIDEKVDAKEEAGGKTELALEQTLFKVRLADNDGRRNTASMLVKKMYSWRGYKLAWHAKQQPNRITLVASHGTSPMATISIGFDSNEGLQVDALYKEELDALRATGARVCEFTKLAVDGAIRSKRVLATLFHIAYIYSYKMNGFTDLFIEVNPRHVRFYQQMLGFTQFGPERLNLRVNAPAVLLRLEFAHLERQLAKFAGKPDLARVEKSLYPYGFSAAEEAGVLGRLTKLS